MDAGVALTALASALFFGLALVVTQLGLRHIGPLPGACISITTAATIFVVLSPSTIEFANWDTESAGLFALIGCLFPAAVTILTFVANERIGPNMAGALGNLAPVFAVLFAIALLGETPGAGKLTAIAVIVLGVVLLFKSPRKGFAQAASWAIWLPLAAALIRGAVQPAVKHGMVGWPNPLAAVTIGYIVSAAVVLLCSAIRERGRPVVYDRPGWLWFAGVGACNGLAVFLMYQALSMGTVTLVAPLVACYPLATVAIGRLWLGKAGLTPWTLIGVGITVAGVALLLLS